MVMTSFRVMKQRGYIPPRMYVKMMTGGALSLGKVLVTTRSGDLKKLRTLPKDEPHFVRPQRKYAIPRYKTSMQCGVTNEKYLRPTLFCNPCHPDIVAMAYQLGAFQKTDYEFAQAAFAFVKEKLILEILPLDGVENTLRRGTGTCFHLISLFIALCRAAGIKARYKMFAMNMIKAWRDAVVEVDPLVKKWYDSMGYFMIEGEGEAWIDGKWVVAHVGPTAERQAAAGIPITRFGEDSIGVWFFALPGTLMYLESIPYGLGGSTRFLKILAPGSMQRVNISILKQIEQGKRIIKNAGGIAAYDKQARLKRGPETPILDLEEKDEIVFKG